jgi:hypothetical protein
MNLPKVAFTCVLAHEPQRLRLEYTLTNHASIEIGVFNHIVDYEIDGTWIVTPDTVYVELVGPVLSVAKRPLEVPEDLDMFANTPPYVSLVSPGGTFRERVHIPLPARVMQPFRPALLPGQSVADRPAQASSLRLSVAAFPVQSDLRLLAPEPAWPQIFEVSPAGRAIDLQQVFSRDFALETPAQVLDYRAVPYRMR